MSLEIRTFKISPDLNRKLTNEPKKNRRFNSPSEILRTLVELYLTDFPVRNFIHAAIERKYPDLVNEDL